MDVSINHAGAAGDETAAPVEKKPVPVDLNAPVEVKISETRSMVLKRPELLAEYDLIEAIGPQVAANTTWVAMAMPLIYVHELDGRAVSKPKNLREVKALIVRLGHEGMGALAKFVRERSEEDGGADDLDEGKVKNS